jgi:general secretion pathway protein N
MRWIVLLLALTGLGIAFMPLAPVLGRLAPGLEAEDVSGTIWNGRLRGARYAGVAIGDADVGLDPRRLVRGEASLAFTRLSPRLSGRVGGTRADRRLEELTGELMLNLLPAPVPAAAIAFDGVHLRLDPAGRCLEAGGRVAARLTGVPLMGETPALEGEPRCEGEALLAPLAARGAPLGLDLRVARDGGWQAALRIGGLNPFGQMALAAAGFRPDGAGWVRLDVEGRFAAA